MNDVKRYDCTNGGVAFCRGCYEMKEVPLGDYVRAEDFDALEAEAQALREQNTKFQHMLTDVVAKHFAENVKRSAAQKSMDVYLSEGIRLLEEEVADARRDAERHELRANQYSEELAAMRARVVVPERKEIMGVFADCGDAENYGWNACLDELARLNGKAVSDGLLRRIEVVLRCLRSLDFHGYIERDVGGDWRKQVDSMRDELRDLLGEGKEHE